MFGTATIKQEMHLVPGRAKNRFDGFVRPGFRYLRHLETNWQLPSSATSTWDGDPLRQQCRLLGTNKV